MKRKKVQRIEKGPKDDGSRWVVIDPDGRQVYPGDGVPRLDAERLAQGLIAPARLRCVQEATA